MARTSVEALLEEFRSGRRDGSPRPQARRLRFEGVGRLDVYNPAPPLRDGSSRLLPARVEDRSSEQSTIGFFREPPARDGAWRLDPETRSLALQDPFWARVGRELVFGGVEVFPRSDGAPGLAWRTRFFRGQGPRDLEDFYAGPEGMKDIRLCEAPGGSVALFTRPQGRVGGRGAVGFALISSIDALCDSAIEGAVILDQLEGEDWCGVNQAELLGDGSIGVVGHVARFSPDGARHYYPAAFSLDPEKGDAGGWRILLERSMLPPGPAKRPGLEDVLFPGGIEPGAAGGASIYLGVSDAEAMVCEIDDPFAGRR